MEEEKHILVMVNGLPGNMATEVAKYILKGGNLPSVFILYDSFTGPEVVENHIKIDPHSILLIPPLEREKHIEGIERRAKNENYTFIIIDYTHPSVVNSNTEYYCQHNLPFVMGTTGGNREELIKTVENSTIPAVIAPNMAKQIVAFQAMMQYMAKNFPGCFKGFKLNITESHQKGKADTSGTAKAMVEYFNKLGIPFTKDQIVMVRQPIDQIAMGVPEEYLSGHGWHTYTLISQDNTMLFEFTHNVNGRRPYVLGTIDAVLFLAEKIEQGVKGKAYTMIDVLRGE